MTNAFLLGAGTFFLVVFAIMIVIVVAAKLKDYPKSPTYARTIPEHTAGFCRVYVWVLAVIIGGLATVVFIIFVFTSITHTITYFLGGML